MRERLLKLAEKYIYNGLQWHLHGLYVLNEDELLELFEELMKGEESNVRVVGRMELFYV